VRPALYSRQRRIARPAPELEPPGWNTLSMPVSRSATLIHIIPESLTYLVPALLKRRCDRILGTGSTSATTSSNCSVTRGARRQSARATSTSSTCSCRPRRSTRPPPPPPPRRCSHSRATPCVLIPLRIVDRE
jgi:hypothetical protein